MNDVAGTMPLFRRVAPLVRDRHGGAALAVSDAPFGFARASATVPLTVDEFERAMLDYPIVFVGPRRRPLAVTGLAPDRNLFVEADGRYAKGAYIPAYLRLYPFALARVDGGERAVVCIDEGAESLVDAGAQGAVALFAAGEPAPVVRDTVTLLEAYHDAAARTDAFGMLLDEVDLLEPRQAHLHPSGAGDGPTLLLDYAAVSRARLMALPAEKLAHLRDNGALAAIHAQLFSAVNWDRLAMRAN